MNSGNEAQKVWHIILTFNEIFKFLNGEICIAQNVTVTIDGSYDRSKTIYNAKIRETDFLVASLRLMYAYANFANIRYSYTNILIRNQ